MANLKFLRVALIFISCSLAFQGHTQTDPASISMSLDECLQYAKENSITLQKAELVVENSVSDELSAKGAFLPTISGSVNQNLNSYPFNKTVTNKTTYSGSYGVDLSLTLYSGGSNRAQLQKSVVSQGIANLEMDELENSLEVSITELYVEILYAIDQIKVAEGSLALSEKNEERGKAFLEVGSINKADLAQLESATASSKYSVVEAQTQLSNLYVALKHLLEIAQDVTFTVKETTLSSGILMQAIPTVADVYDVALQSRPEIQSSQLYIESAELDHTIAKSGYLPKLSLSGGTGINHSSPNSYTFSNQLRDNFVTSIGLNLSIPIFSNYKNKTAVAIAKNNIKTAALSLTETEKDLYQTIETLRNNAVNSQSMFEVSEAMLEATKKSMELTTEQYEVGLKNTIDLLTEQDNYIQTYQEHLVNKYKLVLNKALLNYYKTDIIKL